MPASYHRLALLFVDGVGLAPAGPDNPLSGPSTPRLTELLGGPLTSERVVEGDDLSLAAIDACLGVAGLPQSATGQATLFTGVNAAEHMGRHVPAIPGPRLGRVIAEHSLFRRLAELGLEVTFANAFTSGYLEKLESGLARASASTRAVQAAGVPLRREAELAAGRAVAFDVTRELFYRRSGTAGEPIAGEAAGRHLAAIAGENRLTLFEYFLTDIAGHRRWGVSPEDALSRLDALLAGYLEAAGGDVTLVLVSDHGNLEEGDHRRHTRRPVPLLVVGPATDGFDGVASLVDVAPRIEAVLTGGSTA